MIDLKIDWPGMKSDNLHVTYSLIISHKTLGQIWATIYVTLMCFNNRCTCVWLRT